MNEADTRAEHIDPALKTAGWGVVDGSKILREYPITKGRIVGLGRRGNPPIGWQFSPEPLASEYPWFPMNNPDTRWVQRLQNYQKALAQLTQAVELSEQRALSGLERQGLIQVFEFTHELAWNTLKDLLEARGNIGLLGSRDATRAAFKVGLVEHGDAWMQMIESRNQTTHTYNEEVVDRIVNAITSTYLNEFARLETTLNTLRSAEEGP